MSKWKLYWVESDGYEDCFIVAKNSRSAVCVEVNLNDFDPMDLKASRIMDVSDKYEKIANYLFRRWSRIHASEQAKQSSLREWPYYARDWLLKALGAKFRNLNEDKQILLMDRVYGRKPSGESYVYSVGARALAEHNNQWHLIKRNYDKVDFEVEKLDLSTYVFSAMGLALSHCHEIEYLLSNSFLIGLLGLSDKEKSKYDTINDLNEGISKKTFGQLLRIIQEAFEIEPTIEASLNLFLNMRNKLVHGITKDKRYDIHDEWGQKELISFLDIFLILAKPIKEIALSCYVTSMQFGLEIMKKEGLPVIKLPEDSIEKLSMFCECFKLNKNV